VALHQAFKASGVRTRSEVADRLKVRKSAVSQVFRGDGNLRINTLAEYLFALGFELDVTLVRAGELRRAELEERVAVPMASNATISIVFVAMQGQQGYLNVYTSAQTWLLPQMRHYREFDPVPNSTSRQIIVGELVGD